LRGSLYYSDYGDAYSAKNETLYKERNKMLIYLLLIPLIWGASRIASKRDKFGFLMIAVVLLTLVAGLRGENVGIDTPAYISKFECIADGHPELAYGLEAGFKFLIKCLLTIWNNTSFVFTVIAFFTNYLIIKRLWDFRKIASVPCMVLCYYAGFYGFTLNITRQLLAIAVIFYFSRLLEKRKYLSFLLVVILSAIFLHKTSLICVTFIAADVFLWKNLSKRQRRIICFGVAAAIIAIPVAYSFIAGNLLSKYIKYFKTINLNLGIMLPMKIVFLVATLYISKKRVFPEKPKHFSEEEFREYRVRKSTVIFYSVGLLTSFLGYLFPFMERAGYSFLIFECVYFGILTKACVRKTDTCHDQMVARSNIFIYSAILVLIVGYGFVMSLLGKGQGIVPYYIA